MSHARNPELVASAVGDDVALNGYEKYALTAGTGIAFDAEDREVTANYIKEFELHMSKQH
jgi:hypothetical protein